MPNNVTYSAKRNRYVTSSFNNYLHIKTPTLFSQSFVHFKQLYLCNSLNEIEIQPVTT